MSDVTAEELMAITASRLLADHKVVFAGVGMPLLASAVARHMHAPHLTIVLEGGIIGTSLLPGKLPISTNEMRAAYGAQMLTDITDIFLYAQRGFFDYGFLGAAQVDMYGNINTSVIGSMERPRVRLPGSGGANDIISLCNEVLIVTQHEPRRFVERVDFITSPGYLSGGDSRARAGLACGRLGAVVTDLALLDFEPDSRRMRLRGLQAGVTVGQVREQTGFDLLVGEDIEEFVPPSAEELAIYRELRDGPAAAGPGGAGAEPPGTGRPGTERPGTERPGTERPGTERPGTGRPGSERAAADGPAAGGGERAHRVPAGPA